MVQPHSHLDTAHRESSADNFREFSPSSRWIPGNKLRSPTSATSPCTSWAISLSFASPFAKFTISCHAEKHQQRNTELRWKFKVSKTDRVLLLSYKNCSRLFSCPQEKGKKQKRKKINACALTPCSESWHTRLLSPVLSPASKIIRLPFPWVVPHNLKNEPAWETDYCGYLRPYRLSIFQ